MSSLQFVLYGALLLMICSNIAFAKVFEDQLQDFANTINTKQFEEFNPIINPLKIEDLYIPYANSHFSPLPAQMVFFEKLVIDRKMTKILEVGPGHVPFKLATHVIDHQLEKWKLKGVTAISLDLDFENIPYEDNYFDFVYCRHVLEDLNYPLHAYKEITRVSKNGYFETPSPLIESLRLEAYTSLFFMPKIRGYHHHRYMLYTDVDTNILYALPKFPILDHINPTVLGDMTMEQDAIDIVKVMPGLWNNYYVWFEENINHYYSVATIDSPYEEILYIKPKPVMPMKVIKHDIDYEYQNLHVNGGYATNVRESIFQSIKNSIEFYQIYLDCMIINHPCEMIQPV